MPRTISDKEVSAITALAAPERYSYFVKEIIDSENIWSLKDNSGWVLMSDDQGEELVPAWPHDRFASSCAIGKWTGAVSQPIQLQKWIENWLPGILTDGRQIAVFPTPEDKGIIVDPSRLKDDLEQEMSNYE